MIRDKEAFVEGYLSELSISGKNVTNPRYALGVYWRYLADIDRDLWHVRLCDAQDFQSYLLASSDDKGNLKYSRPTVLNIVGCVSHFYRYLKRMKQVFSNPFDLLKRVKRGRSLPKNILNEEKMSGFLSELQRFRRGKNLLERKAFYRAHVLAELLYSTGMRIGEAARIVPGDIDFDRGTVRITDTKTKTTRDGFLNEYMQRILRIYLSMREYVLFGKNGSDMGLLFGSKGNLKLWFNSILAIECKRQKIGRMSSHHFRHAVGYHLLRSGCDIRYIQAILGHEKLSTTQIYTRVDREDLRGILDRYHPRRFGA